MFICEYWITWLCVPCCVDLTVNHCTFPQLYGALWHLSAPCFGFTATSLNLDAALAVSFPVPVPTCFQLKNSSGWVVWRYLPYDSRKCARWNRFGSRLASLNTKRTRSVGGAAAAALNSTAIDAAGYTGRESSAEVVCPPEILSFFYTEMCQTIFCQTKMPLHRKLLCLHWTNSWWLLSDFIWLPVVVNLPTIHSYVLGP